jgi:sugar phosphate isomerase/epimerase
MTTVLFGYSGFVGGYLLKTFRFDALYNSTNYKQAQDTTVDTVYFAGLPAAKWYANSHPKEDWDNVQNVMNVISTMTVNRQFVLISTIDVYGDEVSAAPTETTRINHDLVHPYGRHRGLFEDFVQTCFPGKVTVLRLPGLFGLGLKKNMIYDLLHNNPGGNLPVGSFQWFDMLMLPSVIAAAKTGVVINIVSEPIHTNDILHLFGREPSSLEVVGTINYNVHSETFTPITKTETLKRIQKYIDRHRQITKQRSRSYKIGVSVIAMPGALLSERKDKEVGWRDFKTLIDRVDIDYCELAPTIFEPDWTKIDVLSIRQRDEVYSFQSITFGMDFNIFLSPSVALTHLFRVIDMAEESQVKVIVFGCPKNRYVFPDIEDVQLQAVQFFRKLGDRCKTTTICVENNSRQYGCNFLTTPQEVASFVRLVNHPQIKMMIDIGNAVMEGAEIVDCIRANVDILGHVHISEPKMEAFRPSTTHLQVAETLQSIGYSKGVTLEMLPKSPQEFSNAIEEFVSIY